MAKANLVLQAQAEVEVKGGGNRQVEACGKVSSVEVVLETQFSYLIKSGSRRLGQKAGQDSD